MLDENLPATLKERARREGTTVQGALCAALVVAGRKTSSAWRKQPVRVMSAINMRAPLGAGEACGLFLVGGMVPFQPGDSRGFLGSGALCKEGALSISEFGGLRTAFPR
jgi:hypothetical protein